MHNFCFYAIVFWVINMDKITVKAVVEKQMSTQVKKVYLVGKGASGSVFCAEISCAPYKIAVKTSEHNATVCEERAMLNFLSDKVNFRVPETFFIIQQNGITFLGMEYIKGIGGRSKLIPFVPNKKHLAYSIVDAFTNMQNNHNNKFGKYDNPQFDSWYDYYKNFFDGIYFFTKEKYADGEIEKVVWEAVELINTNFYEIFHNINCEPCLCHGDFWFPNMIVDFWKSELVSVIDPFDMFWAEPEYELFCLTMTYGKNLKLYEIYKSQNNVSKYCDLKVELYALCNELHWYSVLGTIGHDYLKYRSERLIEQMKEHFG